MIALKEKIRRRQWIAAALFAVFLLFPPIPSYAAPASTSSAPIAPQDSPAEQVPTDAAANPSLITLPVTTLDGKPLDLARDKGWKVIYFWSATCPCVRACESFTFTPLARRYKGQITFYAIASNGYDLHLPHDELVHQVAKRHLPFPVLLDDTHAVAQALDAKITPQAFLLDGENHVLFAGVPDDSRRYESQTGKWGVSQTYLAQAIRQALAGQPVTVPRVKDQGCIIAW